MSLIVPTPHAKVARLPLPLALALLPSPGSRPCWKRAYTASKRRRSAGEMLGRAVAAAAATCSAVIAGAAASSCAAQHSARDHGIKTRMPQSLPSPQGSTSASVSHH